MNLCKDCKHVFHLETYTASLNNPDEPARLLDEKWECHKNLQPNSPVTGGLVSYPDCESMRSVRYAEKCGPAGTYWEAKE